MWEIQRDNDTYKKWIQKIVGTLQNETKPKLVQTEGKWNQLIYIQTE